MRLLSAILLSIVMAVPCISTATDDRKYFSEIHKRTLARFGVDDTDKENEVFQYYDSFRTITGDCDDFASAVYFELWKRGLEPTIIVYDHTRVGYRHVIVCAEGLCFDNNYSTVYPRERFDRRVSTELFSVVIEGRLNVLNMYDVTMHEILGSLAGQAA